MTTTTRTFDAPRAQVWEALIDVRTYPSWLVGARRIRRVDDAWPQPGSAFHHVVGLGPLTLADSTKSVAVEAERRLELVVRARPAIEATVVFTLTDAPGGGTEVEMEEHPIGVYRLVSPIAAPITRARNAASLEKLHERVRARVGHAQR